MPTGPRTLFSWQALFVTTAWGLSLFGVLQLQYLPLDVDHSICGPWGCGPPLPPLLASHGFWFVLLSLPTVLVCRILEPRQLQKTGWLILAVALSGFALVGVWEIVPFLPHWLPRVSHLAPRYYVQRYLLSLATLVDVPIVPLTLAGLYCLAIAQKKQLWEVPGRLRPDR